MFIIAASHYIRNQPSRRVKMYTCPQHYASFSIKGDNPLMCTRGICMPYAACEYIKYFSTFNVLHVFAAVQRRRYANLIMYFNYI